MRVEQRIGRIDRVGQASEFISVLNFLHENTIDQRIWDRLYSHETYVNRHSVDLKISLVKN